MRLTLYVAERTSSCKSNRAVSGMHAQLPIVLSDEPEANEKREPKALFEIQREPVQEGGKPNTNKVALYNPSKPANILR